MVVVPSTVPRTARRPGRQLPVHVQLPLRCVRANVADSLFSFSALESGPLFDRQMPGVRSGEGIHLLPTLPLWLRLSQMRPSPPGGVSGGGGEMWCQMVDLKGGGTDCPSHHLPPAPGQRVTTPWSSSGADGRLRYLSQTEFPLI